jgi:hypothetical protein
MNKFLNGRNIAIGIITLVIGVFVVVGIGKVWAGQTTTVSGNVVSFILNPEGKVDGAILDTGDQVKFGAQTGELVASNIQIGGALSATGHAGTKSNYGREIHAQTLQIGEQTINVIGGKGHKGDKGDKGKRPHPPKKDEKGERGDRNERREPKPEMNDGEVSSASTAKETVKVASKVKFVIVDRKGEARGLILADGTNINLPKEAEDAKLTFDETTSIAVEGEVAKGSFGSFVKPNVLTINNQTFSFNR